MNHIVYEVGSSSGVNHELDVLLGAALYDDNTPKYDQSGRERKNLTVGAVEGDNPLTYTITSPDFTLNNPLKDCYTFEGWTGTDIDGTAEIATVLQGSTGNRTYTAEYEVAYAPILAESSLTLNSFKGQPASATVTATAIFGGVAGTASSVIAVTVSDIAPVLSSDVTIY